MAELDPLFLALQEAVAGRYSLERELGRGGMGVVFLARDVSLDRLVAIKLLPPALAARPDLRERFLREARLAARLSHPNIVPIHSVEEHGALVWFAMAFVPGESLGARLRARGSLPPGETAGLLRDVAWALGYAHAQGVVHRDVKPDNILLEAGGRRALIADFGIAAPAEQGGAVVGTVAYLSPEQATGERVDGRSDLYALGVVGYYALSARLPYPVTTLGELIERQLAGTAPPLAEAAPHVPRALCRTIDRCLAPLPTARFQTGEELAGALEQLGTAGTDLPAPFRVWIQKGEQRRSPAVVISVLWSLPMLIGSLFALASGGGGSWLGFTSFVVVLLSVPWLFVLSSRLLHTRKLLAAGYSHADLVLALEQHAERRREELAFEHGTVPTRAGRLVRLGIATGIAVASTSPAPPQHATRRSRSALAPPGAALRCSCSRSGTSYPARGRARGTGGPSSPCGSGRAGSASASLASPGGGSGPAPRRSRCCIAPPRWRWAMQPRRSTGPCPRRNGGSCGSCRSSFATWRRRRSTCAPGSRNWTTSSPRPRRPRSSRARRRPGTAARAPWARLVRCGRPGSRRP